MKYIFVFFSIIISSASFSQDYYSTDKDARKPEKEVKAKKPAKNYSTDSLPKFYFGFGSGLNNYNGLIGIGGNIRIQNTLFLRAGIGLGSWGNKMSIGMKYDRKIGKTWGYGLSYSTCSGIKNFKTQLETVTSKPNTEEVVIDFLRASTLNFTMSYNWYFHRNKLFYLEFGYSLPIESEPYRVKNGVVLTDASKAALRLLQPGGLVFGLGFMFGK